MEAFSPAVNVLGLLIVLSMIAERFTNVLKMRHPGLHTKQDCVEGERARADHISLCTIAVGIVLALAMKADMFQILQNLNAPWETIGWMHYEGRVWVRASGIGSAGGLAYAIVGCLVTGFALGFGSKFWHDILSAVYQLRSLAKGSGPPPSGVATGPSTPTPPTV